MTTFRLHLAVLIAAVFTIGYVLGTGQWPLAIPLVPAGLVALRPLWRLGGQRVMVLLSVREPPGGDPRASRARAASETNGGLGAPHRGSER